MLRLLYLQREAHRSASLRLFEGTMLLARASIDACISGLYWLDQSDAGAQLTNANAKSAKQMLKAVMEALGVPPSGLDEAARLIGEPADLPKLRPMAEQVARQSGVPLSEVMYEQIYMPLSFMFEHTTGIALQRHVGQDGRLLGTPEQWWTRRRALHTVDVCAGYLALILAEHAGEDPRVFARYVSAHARRMLVPAVTLFGRFARRVIPVTELPKLAREVVSLRRASETYSSFTNDEDRATFAKDRVRHAAGQLNLFDDEDLLDGLIEILVTHLTRADVPEAGA